MKQHTYIAIDLKSFYASVECRERGLDTLDTNLVVADESRTDKTNLSTIICSQREPASWSSMILNDEVSANAILKRATKHYTVVIKPNITD